MTHRCGPGMAQLLAHYSINTCLSTIFIYTYTIFLLTSAEGACAIALNVLKNIYLALKKPTVAKEH